MSERDKTAGCWEAEARWALVWVSHQQLQVFLSVFEYLRVRVSQVFCVLQVGDGEVDSKGIKKGYAAAMAGKVK